MTIYSMTATFGKLEHETLTLRPGLNIISARNEWGKSTWCAFLIAMFYGIETRAKTTRTALADKERYAPWSGSPMSGRIDLNWNGRDITIERSTRGRIPLGEFRAYETRTGLELPEITAENCGQMLLGVERSVFCRSGFIRFSDLNVSDDEAFRRRLNNLVTTGDEDGAAQRLAGELKVLRNRIRYNRTGLLPQAEAEREILEEGCREWQRLEEQQAAISRRMDEAEDWRMALENHLDALDYARAREDMAKIRQTERTRDAALERYQDLSVLCETLPDRETAGEMLEEIRRLEQEQTLLQDQLRSVRVVEEPEALPEQFQGMDAEEALTAAARDAAAYGKCTRPRYPLLLPGLLTAAAGILLGLKKPTVGLICGGIGAAALLVGLIVLLSRYRKKGRLEKRYGSDDPRLWVRLARDYAGSLWLHSPEAWQLRRDRQELEKQLKVLNQHIREATQDQELEQCRSQWEGVRSTWDARNEALREYRGCQAQLDTLRSIVRPAAPPAFPDRLDHSPEETRQLLAACMEQRRHLENLRGQNQARMEALGSPEALQWDLDRVNQRIDALEQRYAALTISQSTLEEASQELQRRFSPRITRRAQELMHRMTGGRYDRMQLSRDLTIQAGAEQEDVLHNALWRSDGTVDQLYLALRLAVARELTPALPLILDDALVRFDDQRLKATLQILSEEAKHIQVILFTCQSREKDMLE